MHVGIVTVSSQPLSSSQRIRYSRVLAWCAGDICPGESGRHHGANQEACKQDTRPNPFVPHGHKPTFLRTGFPHTSLTIGDRKLCFSHEGIQDRLRLCSDFVTSSALPGYLIARAFYGQRSAVPSVSCSHAVSAINSPRLSATTLQEPSTFVILFQVSSSVSGRTRVSPTTDIKFASATQRGRTCMWMCPAIPAPAALPMFIPRFTPSGW
jgi:hypothetical protein